MGRLILYNGPVGDWTLQNGRMKQSKKENFSLAIFRSLLSTRKAGFSLIEMIMVIVIISIIYAFTAPGFSRYNTRKKLEFEAGKVAKVIELAKSTTMTTRNQMKVAFDTAVQEYYYLNATQTGKQFRQDKLHRLDSSVRFGTTPSEFKFKVNGEVADVNNPIIITLEGSGRKQIDITINHRTGRVTIGDIY